MRWTRGTSPRRPRLPPPPPPSHRLPTQPPCHTHNDVSLIAMEMSTAGTALASLCHRCQVLTSRCMFSLPNPKNDVSPTAGFHA